MSKNYLAILCFINIISCDKEDAPGCFKSTGDIQEYAIDVSEFVAIDIHNNINITIEEGISQSVTLTTGANLVNEITLEVIDKELVIKDLNKCNWVRDFGNLNVHIITPQLSQIRSSGGGVISSKGKLNFPNQLSLISRFYTADFKLNLNLKNLEIVNNDVSNFNLTGEVENLIVRVQSGDGRIEAKNLKSQNVIIFHYGTNDVVVNAAQSLKGELRSTGNIIYCTIPDILDIETFDDRARLINSCN